MRTIGVKSRYFHCGKSVVLLLAVCLCLADFQWLQAQNRNNSPPHRFPSTQPIQPGGNSIPQPLQKPGYILRHPAKQPLHYQPAGHNRTPTPQPGRTVLLPNSTIVQPNRIAKIVPIEPSQVTSKNSVRKYKLFPRMAAEFEPQRAIMLSVSDLQPHHSHILKDIIEKSAGHAEILILFNDNQQLKETTMLLAGAEENGPSSLAHVSFYRLQLDTVWLRDFGPRIAEEESGVRSLDFYYYGVRPFDDSFPERWTLRTAGKLTKIPWTLQGGNLMFNGQGLGITTSKLFDDNPVSFPNTSRSESRKQGRQLISKELKQFCNLKQLVILEPLRNESTKHVDMFAAFLAPDHVVVAQVDPRTDSLNSRVLDWNARKLASLKVDGKPMRVDRIRIPARKGQSWSTYTNAIFTDRLVLLPTMKTDGPAFISQAVSTYKRLLPDHHIATVDITSMKDLQGSLHCLSLNLPAFAPMPDGTISFQQAIQMVGQMPESTRNPSAEKNTTFSMDKQLRKIFLSATSDYIVDAYAVALAADVVNLIRVDNGKLIRVRISAFCDADRYWIQRNATKIRTNGSSVKRFVLSKRK